MGLCFRWPLIFHRCRLIYSDYFVGSVVVGATEEPGAAYCRHSTADGVAKLLAAAIRTAPILAEYELEESWAGLRPSTPDLMPLLGRALSATNLHGVHKKHSQKQRNKALPLVHAQIIHYTSN